MGLLNNMQEVLDSSIIENLNTLQQQLSGFEAFNMEDVSLEIYEGYGNVTIHLNRQCMIEEVMEMLDEVLDVKILYYSKNRPGSKCEAVLYTLPYCDEMYMMTMASQQYGVIEDICCTFFESLETMLLRLKITLRNFEQRCKNRENQISCLDSTTIEKLYKDFL